MPIAKRFLHKALYTALMLALAVSLLLTGCVKQPENSVVVYSAADREYAQTILKAFERRNPGIEVVAQYDVESTKTVGLATRIESESNRPRCDLFWNNEIMHTLALEKKGLLHPIRWDLPSGWPDQFRSPGGHWVAIAARARIIVFNKNLLPEIQQRPESVQDLAKPEWKSRCGLARPLFGTTATHFTVLIDKLGDQASREFFNQVAQNAVVLSGNKQVAQQVAAGNLAWGITDTDDALVEIDSGMPVGIIFPDQQPGQLGTLRIPNTVAVIQGCQHPIAAEQLANFLVSEDTEGRLAMGVSGQFPLRPEHPQQSRAQLGDDGKRLPIRWMDVDFAKAADGWQQAAELFSQIF